jgi:hypothetical protein
MNTIELATLKNIGFSAKIANYPKRKHYILQIGKTEARIITQPDQNRALRSFAALFLAICMFRIS